MMVTAVASAATVVLLDRSGQAPVASVPSPQATAAAAAPATDEQATLLLVRAPEGPGAALGITLLAGAADGIPASVTFIPTGALLEVPGFGVERVGAAYQYGGAPLVAAAVENALGITIDATATASDSALGAFLGRVGGVTIDVPERLVQRHDDGTASVRFEAGEQVLDGPRLAEYWAFDGDGELESFSRQQAALGAVLDAASDPAVLDALVGDGAPQLDTTADPTWLAGLFRDLVAARDAQRLRFSLLPVASFGGAGPDGRLTFRLDEEQAARLVAELLAPSSSAGGAAQPLRVQVLNGVGTPGIGQAVDARLDGAFRIVKTENARSFDFETTRIIIYAETTESVAAAERVRELLGVGTIQVSRQPQSVFDLTIVVGADFTGRAPESPAPEPTE